MRNQPENKDIPEKRLKQYSTLNIKNVCLSGYKKEIFYLNSLFTTQMKIDFFFINENVKIQIQWYQFTPSPPPPPPRHNE